jgi:hypothetical protein
MVSAKTTATVNRRKPLIGTKNEKIKPVVNATAKNS